MELLGFGDEALAAFIVFGLGITFTIVWQRYTDKKRRIVYRISRAQIALSVKEPLKDRVAISFDGQAVDSLYTFEVDIENTGNLAINDQILQFQFSEKTDPIAPPECKHRPLVGPVTVVDQNYSPYSIVYNIRLLPVGKRISFCFYTKNNQNDILEVYGRNETHPETEVLEQSSARIVSISRDVEQIIMLLLGMFFVGTLSNALPLLIDLVGISLFFLAPALLVVQGILLLFLFYPARRLVGNLYTLGKMPRVPTVVTASNSQVFLVDSSDIYGNIDVQQSPVDPASIHDPEREEVIENLRDSINQVSKDTSLDEATKAYRINKLLQILRVLKA